MRLTVRRPAPGFFVLLAAAAVAALVLSSFLTSPPFAQSTDSPPAVAMDIAATVAQVRINEPIPVTATFSKPVFGFTVDDITVGNGVAGSFAGSDGDAVYTFDVTPNAIGLVIVDIAAGVAADTGGNGNTAAARLPLGLPYDDDHNSAIDKNEAIAAVRDYFADKISKNETIGVILIYFSGLSPDPGKPTPPPPASTATPARPGAPTGLTAMGNGQTQIDLSWVAPWNHGGTAAITGYRIEVSMDGSNWSDLVADTGSIATTYSHTGLTAGTTRHYRVSAINISGTGPVSNITTGTTALPAQSADRAALVALYHATDGPNWQHKGNWLSEEPIGDWYGVTADSSGRVTNLSLSYNQLSGEIPPELGGLANLEVLYLQGNQLSGEIPPQLGNLANLTGLYLSGNELSGEIPAELGGLANLTGLSLVGNQLSGEIPAELGGLANLTGLWLSYNELSGEIPAELGGLANLTWLWLSENQLNGEIPPKLGNLANLTGLSLHNNQLSGEIPAELGGLANLQELDLWDNQLSGEIPAELGGLANLIWLELHNNQLNGEIPAELGGLANLIWLSLRNNQLSGEIPAEPGSAVPPK